MQQYWVYILLCDNNSYYTGYTNDIEKRYRSHVNGTGGCKYTRSFKPIGVAQCWKISGDKSLAMRLERYIKKLSRTDKEKLILKPANLASDALQNARYPGISHRRSKKEKKPDGSPHYLR